MRSHAGPKKRPEKIGQHFPFFLGIIKKKTAGNRRKLQGTAGTCRELQGIAGICRELQGIAGNCRWLVLTGTNRELYASSRRVGGGPVTGFCHSKAWYKLFILVVPRVPVPPTGKSLTSIKPRQQAPEFPADTLVKAPPFPWGLILQATVA